MSRRPTRERPHSIDIRVGAMLKARRLDLGMSARDVAVRVGVSHAQVHKYEAGLNRLSVATLCDIAGVLDLDLAQVFADLRLAPKTDVAAMIDFDQHDSRHVSALREALLDLPSNTHAPLVQFIRSLSKRTDPPGR